MAEVFAPFAGVEEKSEMSNALSFPRSRQSDLRDAEALNNSEVLSAPDAAFAPANSTGSFM